MTTIGVKDPLAVLADFQPQGVSHLAGLRMDTKVQDAYDAVRRAWEFPINRPPEELDAAKTLIMEIIQSIAQQGRSPYLNFLRTKGEVNLPQLVSGGKDLKAIFEASFNAFRELSSGSGEDAVERAKEHMEAAVAALQPRDELELARFS